MDQPKWFTAEHVIPVKATILHYITLSQVLVQDGGVPSNNGSTTLTVDILDVNDNTPMFLQDSYGPVDVTEEEGSGRLVTKVTAEDDDEQGTSNSRILYSITDVIVTSSNDAIPLPEVSTHCFLVKMLQRHAYT